MFFLITANNYAFIKLLNVAILVLSALVGLRFLTSGMAALNTHQERLHAERERLELEVASAAAPAEVVLESNGGGGTTAVTVLPKAPPVATVRSADPLPLPPLRPASMTLLYVWIALFGFVGTQLAWTLRPFFGSPHEKFQIFRPIEGTFYADLFRTIGHLLGG